MMEACQLVEDSAAGCVGQAKAHKLQEGQLASTSSLGRAGSLRILSYLPGMVGAQSCVITSTWLVLSIRLVSNTMRALGPGRQPPALKTPRQPCSRLPAPDGDSSLVVCMEWLLHVSSAAQGAHQLVDALHALILRGWVAQTMLTAELSQAARRWRSHCRPH